MDDTRLETLGQTIVGALPGVATGYEVAFDQLTVNVEIARIVEAMRFLREDPRCRFVSFIDASLPSSHCVCVRAARCERSCVVSAESPGTTQS